MDLNRLKSNFNIIGDSPLLNRALEIAYQVAPTDLPVLVTGESGVGKESIPKVIHRYSPRRDGKYIAVNCGAIPEGTIDSELFGHKKGAFTGATEARKGYFEEANGGTLFLDEVGELPLSTQVRLLRVLETGEFIAVGSSTPQKTNVRVVAATNVNIQYAVKNGKFREDLYYRLNTVPITIPALRERPEDIFKLFCLFAGDFADRYPPMKPVRLDRDAIRLLEQYRWPGNIRQLKNVAEQISLLEEERSVSAASLHKYLPQDNPNHLPVLSADGHSDEARSEIGILYNILVQLKQEVASLQGEIKTLKSRNAIASMPISTSLDIGSVAEPHPYEEQEPEAVEKPVEGSNPVEQTKPDDDLSMDFQQKDLIKKALQKHNGRRNEAAKELGISVRTLYRKIDKYQIQE